ncbi:hypothetical protein PoB_005756500 [Plakobranchus ocellatus]|uniref:Uncharacterized protein n=1 Tax=Plakobranchus ocellatus TaxID=259542 RepID=A0AAV4CE49_9GAST|nr:hypothetical protein PoB_005756500 [Plakobranchus ocellatus]
MAPSLNLAVSRFGALRMRVGPGQANCWFSIRSSPTGPRQDGRLGHVASFRHMRTAGGAFFHSGLPMVSLLVFFFYPHPLPPLLPFFPPLLALPPAARSRFEAKNVWHCFCRITAENLLRGRSPILSWFHCLMIRLWPAEMNNWI